MTLDLAQIIISCLGLIAWTYFMFDRKNMVTRIDRHSRRLDDHEKRIIQTEASDKSNGHAEQLRMELLNKSISHIEKSLDDFKREKIRSDDEIRSLNKLIVEHIITKK